MSVRVNGSARFAGASYSASFNFTAGCPGLHTVALACLGLLAPALAQAQALPLPLPEIVVTGNPLGSADQPTPSERLDGLGLRLRASQSLGEALNGLAGVSATGFAPGASRPVIRGLDGDRIRVLRNGSVSADAAALSPDHGVPMNMLAVQSVEVLRGPAALLYGGNAMGGVVNVQDSRIHVRSPFAKPGALQTSLTTDWQAASGDSSRAGAVSLDAGNSQWVLHADASARRAGDTRVPDAVACTKPGSPAIARRICNSKAKSDEAALGLSVFAGPVQWGASHSSHQANYGVVAEDEVEIGMRQSRSQLRAALDLPQGPFKRLTVHASDSNYTHTEFEAGAVGTVFATQGREWRLEAVQRPATWGAWRWEGVVGLQTDESSFSADGAEAFAPYSQGRKRAVFSLQQLSGVWGQFSAGVHQQTVQTDSLGHPDLARFVAANRRFSPVNMALGWVAPASGAWQFSANLARAQRAPTDVELYADGPHIATAAYERGDADLGMERARHVELGLKFKHPGLRAQLQVFQTRYNPHIALLPTGDTRAADGALNPIDADADGFADATGEEIFPQWQVRGVPATFKGFEAQGVLALGALGAGSLRGDLSLTWRLDRVRAANARTQEALPNLAPARAGLTLVWTAGPSRAALGFDRHSAQNRVPVGAARVGGYTVWHGVLNHTVRWSGEREASFYAKLDNARNALGYSASSVLTQTAPVKSPIAGRSLRLGLQTSFD